MCMCLYVKIMFPIHKGQSQEDSGEVMLVELKTII